VLPLQGLSVAKELVVLVVSAEAAGDIGEFDERIQFL